METDSVCCICVPICSNAHEILDHDDDADDDVCVHLTQKTHFSLHY